MTSPDATLALGAALLGAGIAPSLPGPVAPATGADFLALVMDLLGRPGGEVSTEPSARKVDDAPPRADDEDTDEPTVDVAPVTAPALVVLPPALLQAVVAAATGEAPADEALTGAVAGPVTPDPVGVTAKAAAPDGPVSADPTPATAGLPAVATPQQLPLPASPATAPPGSAPTAPLAPVAATAAPAPATSATPAARVTHQVFPEVLRVAGLGDGPKRVTVRLQPENLGEVRVVLTSRRGELQVSLSASGGEAHRALVEGTPELRRLLEAVGSTDARVVVRDLAVGPQGTATPVAATTPAGAGTDVRGDLAGGAGAGDRQAAAQQGGQQEGRPGQSPPRGSSTAMDGTPDATNPLRRTESVTRARAGLDVTV